MTFFVSALFWITFQSSPLEPHAYPECENPSSEDGRPYMLCVEETDFEIADARLNEQWRKTLTFVTRSRGPRSTKQLLREQRKWLLSRDRECRALASSSPVTQSGRNQMSCLAQKTEARTAELTQIVR